MASSPGASRITKWGALAFIVVIVFAGSVGFSVWWFWLRGLNEVEEGVQRGTFSLDLNEEKQEDFPSRVPYACSSPISQLKIHIVFSR